MCWPTPKLVFEIVMSLFTVAVVVGPIFKAFHSRSLRLVRALVYVLLSLVFPLIWFFMLGIRYGFLCRAIVVEFYYGMGLCYAGYGIGIFFYLSR